MTERWTLGIILICAVIYGCAQTPGTEPTATAITPPVIDGMIGTAEWAGASEHDFADGSRLLFLRGQDIMYAAIQTNSEDPIASNLFLHEGESVRILHVSAALGSGEYRLTDGKWTLTRAFSWCCRETKESETAAEGREAMLMEEGWTSINGWMGTPGMVEYVFKAPATPFHLAANYLSSANTEEKIPFPAGLADDVALLTPEGLPETMMFEFDDWLLFEEQ